MGTNKNKIPLSFDAIHQELETCTISVLRLFTENLNEKFGFKKENLDSVYSFYEIWLFLLSSIEIKSHFLLKDHELKKRLLIYLIDEMFRDLGINTAKEKNVIVWTINVRLEEYGNLLKKSNSAEELNKNTLLLFVQKLSHAFMKKEFLNEPSIGLFPLQEGIVTGVYANGALFYIKKFNFFLDNMLKTGKNFSSLNEKEIVAIKNRMEK